MAKYTRRLVLLTLTLMIMFPTVALAGTGKQLVEIDAAERARMELERIQEQEAYEAEARRIAAERAKGEEKQQMLLAAQRLRDKEIDDRNLAFQNTSTADSGKACEDGEKCHDKEHCFFFCTLWRIVSYPFRLVYRAVN